MYRQIQVKTLEWNENTGNIDQIPRINDQRREEDMNFPASNQWIIGMVEIWNIGYEKRSAEGGLILDEAHLYKKDRILPNPAFQHSNTPTLRQHIIAGTNYL